MVYKSFAASLILAGLLSVPVLAADNPIDQANQQFSNKALTVKAGDTVTFKNSDDVTHNITVDSPDGDADDLGLQKPGESLTTKIGKPGEYSVHCHIHPKMKMKITAQ